MRERTARQLELPLVVSPALVTEARDSEAGRRTSVRKLNGQFYTPLPVARRLVEQVRWPGPDGEAVLCDPACGDGVFLEAALDKARGLGLSGRRLRRLVEHGLVGWDLDAEALGEARQRLAAACSAAGCGGAEPRLEHRDGLETGGGEAFDCVVGNPPYLEAKRMPDALKARIRAGFPLAGRGAFDLYGAFVELAARLTRPRGGETCLLIPNRFLVVAYAAALRDELLAGGDVDVTDLSRERVFGDAAVYPVIVHTRPSTRPTYQARSGGDDAGGEPLRLDADVIRSALSGLMPVAPTHPGGRRLLGRVLSDPALAPLRRLARVHWTVSFHRAGLRDRYVFPERPAGPRARRFLGGGRFAGNREVRPFAIRWGGAWIDYDEARAKDDRNPFPSAALFDGQKLALCQNARRARAALDREDLVLKDTLLAVRPRPESPGHTLEWLALVVHTDVFHYLYEHLYGGTRKGGGYLHFLPRYLEPFPVPRPPEASAVVPLHERLARQGEGMEEAERLVRRAYGVMELEAEALGAYPFPSV